MVCFTKTQRAEHEPQSRCPVPTRAAFDHISFFGSRCAALTHTTSTVNQNSLFTPMAAKVCLHGHGLVCVYFNLIMGLAFLIVLSPRGSGAHLAWSRLCHPTILLFFPASPQLSVWSVCHKYPHWGYWQDFGTGQGWGQSPLAPHWRPISSVWVLQTSLIQLIVSSTGHPPTHKGTLRNVIKYFLGSRYEVLSLSPRPPSRRSQNLERMLTNNWYIFSKLYITPICSLLPLI